MSRITELFQRQTTAGRKTLIAYLTAGCPSLDSTLEYVGLLAANGVDLIEIGLPFSDPMADGPTIQNASATALTNGVNTQAVLSLVRKLRHQTALPLVVMTYLNPVLRFGQERFVTEFAAAGLDGLIVPDLPLEESESLAGLCRRQGLDFISFIAPTTPEERIQQICSNAAGFLYCISNTGVTGVKRVDFSQIGATIGTIRRYSDLPTAVGFGIGSDSAAREAAEYADAVIVGSALMELVSRSAKQEACHLMQSIRNSIDGGSPG